jgi:hypothetical protein
MRNIQGSAADKLVMVQKMRRAGGFANEDPAEPKAEEIPRTLAAMEEGSEGDKMTTVPGLAPSRVA